MPKRPEPIPPLPLSGSGNGRRYIHPPAQLSGRRLPMAPAVGSEMPTLVDRVTNRACDFLVGAAYIEPGALPRCRNLMIEEIATLILPERRERAYPREVKIKMTGYKRKAPK